MLLTTLSWQYALQVVWLGSIWGAQAFDSAVGLRPSLMYTA